MKSGNIQGPELIGGRLTGVCGGGLGREHEEVLMHFSL